MSNPAADLVAAFGGLTKASRALGWPISTIDSWRSAKRVPAWRLPAIRQAAIREKVELPAVYREPAAEAPAPEAAA